jgi:hypothetical protein
MSVKGKRDNFNVIPNFILMIFKMMGKV